MATFNLCPVQELSCKCPQVLVGTREECGADCHAGSGTDGKQRWSKEVLDAIDTHLSLLERGASRVLATRTDEEVADGRLNYRRTCGPDEGAFVHGNGFSSGCSEKQKGPLVELSSQAPLPDGWEQFLDLRTGQLYYIDWNSFKRSYIDPRKVLQLANERASSFFEQARSEREFPSAEANSECLTTGSSYVTNDESGDEMEVDSKWTAPMQQEDWKLIKSRGWLCCPGDASHSEVSTDACSSISDEGSSSPCGAESEEIVKMIVKGCRRCLAYPMGPELRSWCSRCGDALP